MSRTQIDSLVTLKSLELVTSTSGINDGITNLLLDDPQFHALTKNVCAKFSVELSDRIDNVCGLLGISKRRFMEAAVIDALEKSSQIMEAEGVFARLASEESAS